MHKLFKCLIFMLIFTISMLQGEIEEIIIKWNPFICLDTCIPRLASSLQEIPEIANLKIDSKVGVAIMTWDPMRPYSYEPIRRALANAGATLLDMRMRIKGTVYHEGESFYLDANGNNTRFLLVGPLRVDPYNYVPRYSLAAHELTLDMKSRLLTIEKSGELILIAGPLYLPAQYPQILIIEDIKKLDKEERG